jgi:protein-tyrosine-phosphatase
VTWKRHVPPTLRRWRNVLSQLDARERRTLFVAALDATLHPRRRDWRSVVRNADHVVFVCHGNIIRSPLGEAAFAREAAARGRSVEVSSAGLSARPGEPADSRAIDSAEERGLGLEAHRARLLDAAQVAGASAIFIMDHINLARILTRFPDAADKVFLLGGCRPDGRVVLTEIHDPVSGSLADVHVAHDEVVAAVRLLSTAWDPTAP